MLGTFLLPFLFGLLAPLEEVELELQGKRGWGDQVNFLLGEIERLKADHQICDCALVDAQDPAAAAAGQFGLSVYGRGGSFPLYPNQDF